MFDHIGLTVADLERSRRFYVLALDPLGIRPIMDVTPEASGGAEAFVGFGRDRPQFWIGTGQTQAVGLHVAFTASTRAQVDDFYAAALTAGGTDNGGPGLRPHYHPNYYGAFVRDLDGHNIEAVCHVPA